MKDHDHARMMLAMSAKDLKAVRGMLHSESFDAEIFGFHAQQAVEKAAKAWLSQLSVRYPKTHDLEELFAALAEAGASLPDEFRALDELTEFAVHFRYENFEMFPPELDRVQMLGRVEKFFSHVQGVVEAGDRERS